MPVFGNHVGLKFGHLHFYWQVAFFSCICIHGLISYSLYLFHQPVLAIVRLINPSMLEGEKLFAILILMTGFGYLSWRFIETPFRSVSRVSLGKLVIVLSGAITVMCGFALSAKYTNGFIQRFSEEDDRALLSLNETEMARYTPQQFMSHRLEMFSERIKKSFNWRRFCYGLFEHRI